MILNLRIARLPHGADLPLPAYQSAFAAGLDLYAAVPADAPIVLAPGAQATIPTGITLALPPGTEGQVRPRSGLAARHGVTVLNTPGTIDADYRGEVAVAPHQPRPSVIRGCARHADRAVGGGADPARDRERGGAPRGYRPRQRRLWING